MNNFSVEYFVELLSQVFDNSIDHNFVCDWLDRAVEKVEADFQAVQVSCEETNYHEESPEEIDFGLSALENYRESLGLLEDYFQCGDTELLEEAANLAVSTHEMFQHAMEYNRVQESHDIIDACF